MVIFRLVKNVQRCYFSDDGVGPNAGSVNFRNSFFSNLALVIIMIKDGGAVLGAHVGSLPIKRCGIVDGEKHLQYLLKADLFGVKRKLDHFGVTRRAGSHQTLVGISDGTASVTRDYFFYAL